MIDKQKKSGFALLISLVVVSAILSIGLVILDLTIKQVRLAATTKDSETAFHAANAGKECAMYWRREERDLFETGADIPTIDCFGESVSDVEDARSATVDDASDGDAYVYEYDMTWNDNDRCTRTTIVVAVAESDDIEVTNIQSIIPGYPDSSTFDCVLGGRCTVISVQGYNKACSQISSYGTIEREILLRF